MPWIVEWQRRPAIESIEMCAHRLAGVRESIDQKCYDEAVYGLQDFLIAHAERDITGGLRDGLNLLYEIAERAEMDGRINEAFRALHTAVDFSFLSSGFLTEHAPDRAVARLTQLARKLPELPGVVHEDRDHINLRNMAASVHAFTLLLRLKIARGYGLEPVRVLLDDITGALKKKPTLYSRIARLHGAFNRYMLEEAPGRIDGDDLRRYEKLSAFLNQKGMHGAAKRLAYGVLSRLKDSQWLANMAMGDVYRAAKSELAGTGKNNITVALKTVMAARARNNAQKVAAGGIAAREDNLLIGQDVIAVDLSGGKYAHQMTPDVLYAFMMPEGLRIRSRRAEDNHAMTLAQMEGHHKRGTLFPPRPDELAEYEANYQAFFAQLKLWENKKYRNARRPLKTCIDQAIGFYSRQAQQKKAQL